MATPAISAEELAAQSSNIAKSMEGLFAGGSRWLLSGAGIGLGAGVLGAVGYGALKTALPNNVDMEDPLGRIKKGAMAGAMAGTAIKVAQNAESVAAPLVREGTIAPWLGALAEKATSVTSKPIKFLGGSWEGGRAGLIGGAMAAAFVMGSGSLRMSRPINPVDSVY
jgi:hypothetical protein